MKITNNRKLISLILAVFLSMSVVSCSGDIASQDNSQNTQNPVIETESDPSKTDHNIVKDYKKITYTDGHDARIMFVNVGKADAIIVEVGDKYWIVDTGTNESVPSIIAAMNYMGCTSFEGMIITHSDNDHVGGADTLLDYYDCKVYYTTSIDHDMPKMTAPALNHNIEHKKLEPGEIITLADGLYLEVYAPYRYNPMDENNNSLVLRTEINGTSLLLMGDACKSEEKTLLKVDDYKLDCDILKVGHHGYKDATSKDFIDIATPDISIICTDTSTEPDTANPIVTKILEDSGSDILITQDYELGILIDFGANGKYEISNPSIEDKPVKGIEIESVSKENQTVTIKNTNNEDVDISRFYIFSDKGCELFVFPDGSMIPASSTITVGVKNSVDCDYIWDEVRVWNKSSEDIAILYDNHSNLLDTKPSE